MNLNEAEFSVSPFWYRRICEIAVLVAVFLLAFFAIGFFSTGMSPGTQFLVPFPVALLAVFIGLGSGVAYFLADNREQLGRNSLLVYLGMSLMVAVLLLTTGPITSPFIALWILISVFAGLFGTRVLIGFLVAINAYLLTALFAVHTVDLQSQLYLFILAYELPILVSWLIWHHKGRPEQAKERAYNDLVKELSQVANKSEIVINAIADGVIAVDSQGVIQLINPAAQEILGWVKQDALKLDYRSVLKLTNKEGKPLDELTDPIKQVLRTNTKVVDDNLTLETNAGRKLLVSVLASPVGQTGAGVIVVFRDITKQKEEERQQAEFISTASHEMRTPVATIEGYLGLALNPNTAAIDEKARTYLLKAHESVLHLGQLFQDLLDISKVDDGRISNNPAILDVGAFTEEVVTGLQTKAEQKGLVLVYKPKIQMQTLKHFNPVYYANLDANHLREILGNLIENAIKYTKTGSVSVDVTGTQDKITVSIHDTGIGVATEDVPHLFQKFYRVDNADTRKIGGTGLGLYLCRRLVETMGGRIWLESKLGEGSTFYVEFERVSHEDASRQIEKAVLSDSA